MLERYQDRYTYIMVDEYQDTNHAQYRLINLLAAKRRNICVVGDDDQSIYKFRGANIENILGFEKDFPGAMVIRLEQNYRCTKKILDAANEVIAHNAQREGQDPVDRKRRRRPRCGVYRASDEGGEALFVANTILENVAAGARFSDHAVLYRMNAQSNAIEKALLRAGVPYRVISGVQVLRAQGDQGCDELPCRAGQSRRHRPPRADCQRAQAGHRGRHPRRLPGDRRRARAADARGHAHRR